MRYFERFCIILTLREINTTDNIENNNFGGERFISRIYNDCVGVVIFRSLLVHNTNFMYSWSMSNFFGEYIEQFKIIRILVASNRSDLKVEEVHIIIFSRLIVALFRSINEVTMKESVLFSTFKIRWNR